MILNKSLAFLSIMLIGTMIPGMMLSSMPSFFVSGSHLQQKESSFDNKILQKVFAQYGDYGYDDHKKPYGIYGHNDYDSKPVYNEYTYADYKKKKNFAQIERFDDKLFVCDNGIVVDDRTQCPLKCPFGTTLDGAYVMDLEICDIEPGTASKKCPAGTDLEGVLVTNKNQCDLFDICDADSPLGLSLGGLEPIKVADVQLCQLSAPSVEICDSGFFEGFAVDNQQTCNTPLDQVSICGPTSDLAGMLTTDIQSCNIFETCLANSPLGMALGGTEVDVADAELCNLEIPEQTELVVCDLDTPMGGAVVTDPLLCQAPNDNNKCPADTDLEGAYVMDTASDCNIFATCDAGTALGKALGMQNEFKVADEVLCDLEVPEEVELFQCIGGPMEDAIVTDPKLCEGPNSANKCPANTDLEGAYVMNPITQCNLDIPEPIVCPDSGFLVNDEANCPLKCPDGKYLMNGTGMECPSIPLDDLAISHFISADVSILLSEGDGTFTEAPGSPISVGSTAVFVTTGLFDSNTNLDLAVANFGNGGNPNADTVSILLNQGDDTFTEAPGSPISVGDNPVAIGVGLFDDDDLDLAVVNQISRTVSIILGNGDSTFTEETNESPIDVGITPNSITVGFFDPGTSLDLAVAHTSGEIRILLGDNDGTFATGDTFMAGNSGFISFIASGLLDGDNILDLAITDFNDNNVIIFRGDGDGTFTEESQSPIAVGESPRSLAIGLLNADSDLDIVVANSVSDNVSVLLGNGDGTFSEAPDSPISIGVDTSPRSIAIGLFNEDSDLDIAVANESNNTVSVLLGNGDGTFSEAPDSPITVEQVPVSLAAGGFN